MAAGALLHFIHTPLFDESAEEVLGLDGLREVQAIIQANPDVGRLIKVDLILAYAKTEADEISEAGRRTLKSIIRDL